MRRTIRRFRATRQTTDGGMWWLLLSCAAPPAADAPAPDPAPGPPVVDGFELRDRVGGPLGAGYGDTGFHLAPTPYLRAHRPGR